LGSNLTKEMENINYQSDSGAELVWPAYVDSRTDWLTWIVNDLLISGVFMGFWFQHCMFV